MNYRNYTQQDIANNAAKVKSMSQLLLKLGLKQAGGNYNNMKKLLQKYKIDCSHWTGKSWNKDKQLKDWSDYKNNDRLRIHLIKIRGHQCEICKLDTWLSKPIKIELHHMDGDRVNNDLSNLQLLCPNCHSMTDNFRSHNRHS